jgi:fused signal recognition particle receptor
MGLFSFLKSKFSKKKDESTETYVQGMSKSRAAFASRLDDLSKRYASVNQQYFEELEQILIESDVGVDLSLRLIEKLLDASKEQKISEPSKINEMLIDEMFVSYATAGAVIKNEIQFVSEGPPSYWSSGLMGWARPPRSPNSPTVIKSRGSRSFSLPAIPSGRGR